MLERLLNPVPALPVSRQLFSNRALRAMIVPLLIEQLLQMVVGIADTLMVSYAGEATVSGVSLDTMLYTIFIYLFTAIATGGSVVVSQYLGSGDKARADLAAAQIFRLGGLVSLACMTVMLLFGQSLLSLLYPSADAQVMAACRTYLWIVTLSFPANAIYFGLWLGLGVVGIALAMGADWCIKGALDIWRWKSGRWKAFKVIG